MKKLVAGLALAACVAGSLAMGGEVGFIEQFSLAGDRSVPLKELIPGTQDYYYYHCLHDQNMGRLDQVEDTLKLWIKRHNYTARVHEILNRQALLLYEKDPKKTLARIKTRLNLHFDHQREVLGRKPDQPTRLDQDLISRKTLSTKALAAYRNLNGFEESAFDFLIAQGLNGERRRDLLRRLKRPDYPGLAKLVVDDLAYKYKVPFGSHPIHRLLLRTQLDECLTRMPALINNSTFVNVYLTKLHPTADQDWEHDVKVREAYLGRLWDFVNRLAPAFNSLKVHVLYHRLVHDRALGVYDKDRFLTYIKLPRSAAYVEPVYLRDASRRNYLANLRADYRSVTLLPRVQNDEPVVRDYLQQFFVKEDSFRPYAVYIRDSYLQDVFAETKIVNGIGDQEKWYKMLSPTEYQALKDRIDLDFAPTNKTTLRPDDPVTLALDIKNVKKLIVKVYEINAFNYYRDRQKEVGTDINLDGLVANEEKVHKYDEPALRRVRRTFRFPALRQRGVYVVEFIGNGRSSRALIRKGRLRYLERLSSAGHVFSVLDESNRKVPEAVIWLAGHKYEPDEDGLIVIPFTARPTRQPIILSRGNFSTLDAFSHTAETYSLAAGIHVDREALIQGQKATVLIRPVLYLNDSPVTLSILKDVSLTIASVDRDGVSTVKDVKDFKLFESRESTYEFKVPAKLSRLTFTVKGRVKNLSQNKQQSLAARAQFTLNEIDRTDKIEALHLVHLRDGYVLELLGKTGEPKPNRPITLELKHRDFRRHVHAVLQTDKLGQTLLGALQDIDWICAGGPDGTRATWHLSRDSHSYPATLHAKAAETVHVPYMGSRTEADADAFSLLERRGNTFVKNRRDVLSISSGFVVIKGLGPGDYDLLLKETGTHIALRVTDGLARNGYVLSENRLLETRNTRPLQIAAVDVQANDIKVRLKNSSTFARVHVLATRFMPAYSASSNLGRVTFLEPDAVPLKKPESIYLSGRDIGDEYRYILDRKYAKRFPGNMLKRPGLLLNPWALRKTETRLQEAQAGRSWGRRGRTAAKRPSRAHRRPVRKAAARADRFANLDFLAQPTVLLANLEPDDKGEVTVSRKQLGPHQQLHIVAVDPQNTVCREVALPKLVTRFRRLQLLAGLDPKKHYTEQKKVSIVRTGKPFTLKDITTSDFEAYDSLARVYALYATLSGNQTLGEFSFVLRWPDLKPEEKQEKYSKYACHELSFFIHQKDPDFFRTVVLPYLKNKKDKTFMDHWLVGDDLSAYLKPWAFAQLNIVERVLLARRIQKERPHTARHVRDLWELIPPNVERFNHLFKTALKGSALEVEELYDFDKAKDEAGKARLKHAIEKLAKAEEAEGARRYAATKPAAAEPRRAGPELSGRAGDGKKADDALYDRAWAEKKRQAVRQFYQKLDKTKEWAENNYYHLPIERQNASLVTVNSFWLDYAGHDGKSPFLSTNVAEASGSFTEMMLALAVLDLPFQPKKHAPAHDARQFTLTAASPMIVFHKEIQEAEDAARQTPILVSQNCFKHNDRYRHVNNERVDKYVTEEFVVHTVYGCQVVVTNPTSSRQKLDVLLQIPQGSLPVMAGFYTRSIHLNLRPYSTTTFDYRFYFPIAGDYAHYPVHVAKEEKLIGQAKAMTLKVVDTPSKIDRTSWDYVSQHASADEVMAYLQQHNLNRINLARVAFRMRDKAMFRKVIDLLSARHLYNHTLWSYGVYQNDPAAIREYLQSSPFAGQCGTYIDCALLTIDPVARKTYQHLEYMPLVNARAHRLGQGRQILNARFHAQYLRLMKVLSYRRKLNDTDLMTVTYYLLLQDRVDEAMAFFKRVDPTQLATRLQYDYFKAYIDFFSDTPTVARTIANKYKDYPVPRWRKLFQVVASQLDEIEGKGPKVADDKDRTQVQTRLAATEASFDFNVESRKVNVEYQNLKACTVNYYLMDIELLFSRSPFVQHYSGQFAYIRPNETDRVDLPTDKSTFTFDLPRKFHNSNVMVEIIAGGTKKSKPYYSHSLALQVIENYGQVKITDAKTRRPLPKVYVKVYARMKNGRIRFYKDGYTDLRGRFDYTSLNTNELDNVQKFSILIVSEKAGAVIREAAPPKR